MGSSDVDVGKKVQEFGDRNVGPHFPASYVLYDMNLDRMLIFAQQIKGCTAPSPTRRLSISKWGEDDERGTMSSQLPDGSISEKMRSALMKRVVLEKRRTGSYKKVDLRRVFDPKGIPISFPRHSLYHGTRSIMWLILGFLL